MVQIEWFPGERFENLASHICIFCSSFLSYLHSTKSLARVWNSELLYMYTHSFGTLRVLCIYDRDLWAYKLARRNKLISRLIEAAYISRGCVIIGVQYVGTMIFSYQLLENFPRFSIAIPYIRVKTCVSSHDSMYRAIRLFLARIQLCKKRNRLTT